MKATRNLHHIDIDDTQNKTIKMGDVELYFDSEYRPEWTAVQWGTLKRPAMSINKQINMTIPEVGDTVYFHHQVFENLISFEEENFRWAEHTNLFFIIKDEEIIMLNSYVLIKPKIEDESKLKKGNIFLKHKAEVVEQRGYVVACALDIIPEGTEVAFQQMADYKINIKDEEFYVMELSRIIATIDNEVAEPIGNWSLIEPLDEGEEYSLSDSGLYLPSKTNHKRQHQGRIHRTNNTELGIKDDDIVIYDRKGFYSIMVNDKKLYGVNTEEDIFILL